ncbi:DUF4442 domain-containing protein [Bizionia gelidisalsuginis]|uniref:DUF4442 domain-containing protein n=2 Tax=Bizionia TaxID=283785 RepID=A0A8H2LEG6_9FLAO|nr:MULTISPECIES: DUF4442 domain-containing protein [Bizionia]TYB77494.1 DUF4442 domain-containing protein [Bizionia saleffrena]TYC17825.1 DUF4442 domain-containing protein [Bizionia gelidisalsuginis]
MKLTPLKINLFNLVKLPAVFFTGVRVKEISERHCKVSVRHRWINQNPFKSMFWAVQGMAAELTTGALVLMKINKSGRKISMLVSNNKATFTKKATGKITFVCNEGDKIETALKETIKTGLGHTFWMTSIGTNSDGVVVSTFDFEWSVKVKN